MFASLWQCSHVLLTPVTWGLVDLRGLGRLGHQGSTADDLREAEIRDGPRSLLSNKSDAEMGKRRGMKMNLVWDL